MLLEVRCQMSFRPSQGCDIAGPVLVTCQRDFYGVLSGVEF